MAKKKVIYVVVPPEEEKGLVLTGRGHFDLRAITKELPSYSSVICGHHMLQKSMSAALNIDSDTHVKIPENEFEAFSFLETLENKTLLIAGRFFLNALGHRNIEKKTMLVKISLDDPVEGLNSIEEIA